MNTSAVIIGGGLGGLFSGAFLAKNGIRVTVVEKNHIIGGGLQCFRRGDKYFETGMHIMGGFEEGGSLTRICRYLGILDSLKIHHIDSRCMDEIRYEKTQEVYRIPSGREAFVKAWAGYFPHEEAGIRAYVDAIYQMSEEVPLFNLREQTSETLLHSDRFSWSADRLIAHYISDTKLQELLAYLNPLYGGVQGHTPAYVHALINVLYINGASRFVDGSQQLADALQAIITSHGGEVVSGCEVSRIHVIDKKVVDIETADQRRFSADWYISAVHPVEMLRLIPEGTFLRGFVNRLHEIPVSYSAFSLFIDLKPSTFEYIDHTCYYMDDYGSIWTQDRVPMAEWPYGFMYMTPPATDQGPFADRLLVHCIMSFDQVRAWEDTRVGRRGPAYEAWKQACTDKVMGKLEHLFPGFRAKVDRVYAASPLTIRDYYHTKEGALFGYRKDCQHLLLSQISVYTKVQNLLLTGQNINLHGICGVPLTAINTCEAILGTNFLIKEINHA